MQHLPVHQKYWYSSVGFCFMSYAYCWLAMLNDRFYFSACLSDKSKVFILLSCILISEPKVLLSVLVEEVWTLWFNLCSKSLEWMLVRQASYSFCYFLSSFLPSFVPVYLCEEQFYHLLATVKGRACLCDTMLLLVIHVSRIYLNCCKVAVTWSLQGYILHQLEK